MRRGGAPIGGGGGGGAGSTIPAPGAAGLLFTSTGPLRGDWGWEPAGGFSIVSFTPSSVTTEVGDAAHAAITNPPFAATYSELPDNANVTNTDGTDSPHVLTTPFAAATIAGVFGPKANGVSVVFTLHATKGATTLTRAATKLWSNPICAGAVPVGDVAATQGFIDELAALVRQLHTANAGSYALNPTAGKISAFAIPAAYGTPTVFDGSFFVSPLLIGNVPAWNNGRGVTISMNVYTASAAGIGATTFTLS